jgi:triacylglycerol lipase
MMASWLRRALAVQAVLLIVAGVLLVRSGTSSLAVAVVGAVGAFLAVNACVIVVTFAISRSHASASAPEPMSGFLLSLRIVIGEWLAYQALFVLIQPFERLWMGNDAVGRQTPASVPVLLIHGYMCNRGVWWWIRRGLKGTGLAVATVNLEPPLGSIDGFADQLHDRIEALRAETGADQVALVGHSMGGLVARAYLHRHGSSRVAKLVTLASPHHGTRLARYGLGKNARQMRVDSAWTRALPTTDPRVPTLTVWSPTDNFVVPQDSSRLTGAREMILPGLSHLTMFFSFIVLDVLTRELAPSNRISPPLSR